MEAAFAYQLWFMFMEPEYLKGTPATAGWVVFTIEQLLFSSV